MSHPPFPLQRAFPFIRTSVLIPFLLLGIGSTSWLIVRFRALDSDSIMYGLPLAFATGPFSLTIPFMGEFPPYSSVWGHQWPGAMWMRGALYAIVPFDRWFDIALLFSFQVGAAFLAGYLVWRLTRGVVATLCTIAVVASDRVIIAGLQLHRWEAISNFALMALLTGLVLTAGKRCQYPLPISRHRHWWMAVAALGAFLAGITHPFATGLAFGLVALAWIDALMLRRRWWATAALPSFSLLLGLLAVALYFHEIPAAMEQFRANVALQHSFNSGSRWGFFTTHLRYYHWLGYALWGAALLAAPFVFSQLAHRKRAHRAFAAWALPLAAAGLPALFILTRSANNSYAVLGLPFAMVLVASATGLINRTRYPVFRSVSLGALIILACGFLSVFPYRWLIFFKQGTPDFPAEMAAILDRLPPGVRVYIPPPMWDVARQDPTRDYRLWSLSIAAPWETRLRYETQAYAEAKEGDILIVDRLPGTTGDPWGILPTFETRPPDPRAWQHLFEVVKRVPGRGHDFGYDFAIFRRVDTPWKPADSPRAMHGN
ncbi:MAG: hypothetical protein SFU53_01450 [Terrimicrobiaceae bacterium]|nr:hypothetical protein [Terrimicrobiaceae bacterium]